jgi:hypothetical protein
MDLHKDKKKGVGILKKKKQNERPYIVTSPENTYPRGKNEEIKVHRSSACGEKGV